MRRIFAVLSVLFLFCFISGCAASHIASLPPTGPQQAQLDADQSVALVSDFGAMDAHHGPFCSGVWVSPSVIMTAGHCVAGYAHMKRRILVIKALQDAGVPEMFAMLFSGMDVEDIDLNDPELPPMMADIVKVMMSVPPVPEQGLDVPFIVPSEVVDNGVAPTQFHHTSAQFVDHKADLALLKVVGPIPEHQFAGVAAKSPLVGEDVTSIGTVQGEYFSFRHETVAAYRHSEKADGMKSIDGPFMQLSGSKISRGDSGSGIFNTNGQLVGITSFVNDEADVTYCIHLSTIKSVLIGQRLLKANIDVTAKDPDLSEAPVNLE